MPHRRVLLQAILSCSILFPAACTDDDLVGPQVGSAEITITTSGVEPDPDGYTYQIDSQSPQATSSSARTTVPGLTAGDHNITLSGLAANCSVSGSNPRRFSIAPTQTTTVELQVNCVGTTGTLAITLISDGESVDADGYLVTITGNETIRIAANGTTSVPVVAGTHRLELQEVAANCSVSGENPRSVTIGPGAGVAITFQVHCLAASGAKIAYESRVNFSTDVVVMNPDGSARRKIPDGGRPGLDGPPVWSPDGARIAFVGISTLIESHVFIASADGSNLTKVSPAGWQNLAWSPDGSRIAFLDESMAEPHLFVVNADGTERHQLTHGLPLSVTTLSWSPDGRHILVGRPQPLRIVRVNADGSGERDLTTPGNYESDESASWSPDGHTIAFLRRAAPPPFQEFPLQNLWVMDADGANLRNVTGYTFDDVDYFADSYGWAPDSDRLAFTHGLGILSVLRKDGSDRKSTHWESTSIHSPSWSPDGSKIMLMISTEAWVRGIALVNPDGSNLTRIGDRTEQVERAVWQP